MNALIIIPAIQSKIQKPLNNTSVNRSVKQRLQHARSYNQTD